MTKHEQAEKYVRDGGCGGRCWECLFYMGCTNSILHPLALATKYLKTNPKEKKMDDWKDLTLTTLPKDIDHTKEPLDQYDIEESSYPPVWTKTKHDEWWPIIRKVSMGTKYRYRPIKKEEVSHEEIMTKWWEDRFPGQSVWAKVLKVRFDPNGVPAYTFYSDGLWFPADWFQNRKSSVIPPEAE